MSDDANDRLKGPRWITGTYFCSIGVAVDCISGKCRKASKPA